MKRKHSKRHPSEEAFMTNPIASNQDATGFVPSVPTDEFEAQSYRDVRDVPVTAQKDINCTECGKKRKRRKQ